MDIDNLLNLERRTGIKNDDIEDFVDKASKVQQAIQDLLSGKVDPENCRVEGIDTEEEKAEKERLRLERQKQYQEKEKQLQLKRKQEEIERWWSGAEFFKPKSSTELEQDLDDVNLTVNPIDKLRARYNFDYSRWEQWVPNDEATKEEIAANKRVIEEQKNKEFESQNPEFCSQFLSDAEKRQQIIAKKQESADISRLKGNRYFKARNFERALELYMEALKESPYDSKTLLNVAQVHIKSKNLEDASEFIKRTLYLEPKNVKALSRKAFVHCEMKNMAEATEAISQALLIDPHNIELIALQKEIKVIDKEINEELAVADLSLRTATDTQPLSLHDRLNQLRDQICTTNDTIAAILRATVWPDMDIEKQLLGLSKEIRGLLSIDDSNQIDSLRTMMRTSEALKALVQYFQALLKLQLWEMKNGKNSQIPTASSITTYSSEVVNLLAKCTDQQRGSKVVLVENRVISSLKTILQHTDRSYSFADKADLSLLFASVKLLLVLGGDDLCVKTRAAVLGEKTLMCTVGSTLGNISYLLANAKQKSLEPEQQATLLSLIQECVSILKALAFSDFAKSVDDATGNAGKRKAESANLGSLICALGSALMICGEQTKNWKTANDRMRSITESCIESLLGFSQYEQFRDFFAIPLPAFNEDEKDSTKNTASSISMVLKAMSSSAFKENLTFASNCLACLMNASLDAVATGNGSSIAVKEEVIRSGGVDMLLAAVQLGDVERSKIIAAGGGNLLSRKAGLLSRLAPLESVQKLLLKAKAYRAICRRLVPPSTSNATAVDEDDSKAAADEKSHYIRTLASIGTATIIALSKNGTCIDIAEVTKIALEENLISSLLAVFPRPKDDCGVITPQTVTLMPTMPASPLLIGNAARCLMTFADISSCSEQLYGSNKKYQSLIGVEKLICAMATCVDMRVRKNIAILLAKGCKVPGIREKITELRGMQMMVELQDRL
eukprot:gene25280-33810_t